jgi:hypothetical protein
MKIIGHAAIVWLAFLSVTFSSCIKSGEITQSPNRGLNQPVVDASGKKIYSIDPAIGGTLTADGVSSSDPRFGVATVAIPPGTLNLPVSVSIFEAQNLINSEIFSIVGSSYLTAAGPTVAVLPSQSVAISGSLAISIPYSALTALTGDKQLVVIAIYPSESKTELETFVGNELDTSTSGVVKISTKKFGAFQVAHSDSIIEKKRVETALEIKQTDSKKEPASGQPLGFEVRNVVVTKSGATDLTLRWTKPSQGSDFIYRVTKSSGTVVPESCDLADTVTTSGTEIVIQNLLPKTAYAFRICSVYKLDGVKMESTGIALSAATKILPPLDASALQIAQNPTSPGDVELSWAAGVDSDSYRILYSIAPTSPAAECRAQGFMTTKDTKIRLTGLPTNKTYNFRICSVNANPTPDISTGLVGSAFINSRGFANPQGASALEIESNWVKLSWNNESDSPSSYRIIIHETNTAEKCVGQDYVSSKRNSAVITGLKPSTNYRARICAVNYDDIPLFSSGTELTFTTSSTVSVLPRVNFLQCAGWTGYVPRLSFFGQGEADRYYYTTTTGTMSGGSVGSYCASRASQGAVYLLYNTIANQPGSANNRLFNADILDSTGSFGANKPNVRLTVCYKNLDNSFTDGQTLSITNSRTSASGSTPGSCYLESANGPWPSISISQTSKQTLIKQSNFKSFPLTGSCSPDNAVISVRGDINAQGTCASGSFQIPLDFSTTPDGNIRIAATSNFGAYRSESTIAEFSKDASVALPVVSIQTLASGSLDTKAKLENFVIRGSCSLNGSMVKIGGSLSADVPCTAGAWSLLVPKSSIQNSVVISAYQTNSQGDDGPSASRTFENGTDCAPSDDTKWQMLAYNFRDLDGDSYTVETPGEICTGLNLPNGYFLTSNRSGDCNDNDSQLFQSLALYADRDGDGVGSGNLINICFGWSRPSGYSDRGSDCNDDDPSIFNTITYYEDKDSDGYGANGQDVCSLTPPTGRITQGLDCNDNNPNLTMLNFFFPDEDGDGWPGKSGRENSIYACTTNDKPPYGYAEEKYWPNWIPKIDCDDSNSAIYPGAPDSILVFPSYHRRDCPPDNDSKTPVSTLDLPTKDIEFDTHNNYVVVGMPLDSTTIPNAGRAKVYLRSDSGITEEKTLAPQDLVSNSQFGRSVKIFYPFILISAPNANNNRGKVYIYRHVAGQWIESGTVSGGSDDDKLGSAISVSENAFIACGSSRCSVYEFRNNSWTATKAVNSSELGNPVPSIKSCAISADRFVIGATRTAPESGIAAVYKKSGQTWLNDGVIQAPPHDNSYYWESNAYLVSDFGSQVAVSGGTVVAGPYGRNDQFGVFSSSAQSTWKMIKMIFNGGGNSLTSPVEIMMRDNIILILNDGWIEYNRIGVNGQIFEIYLDTPYDMIRGKIKIDGRYVVIQRQRVTDDPSTTYLAWMLADLHAPAPDNLVGFAGNTMVSLRWDTPWSKNYEVIGDYVVQQSLDNGETWATIADGVSSSPQATVSNLTNGTTYQFRVKGVTDTGQGTPSKTISITPQASEFLCKYGCYTHSQGLPIGTETSGPDGIPIKLIMANQNSSFKIWQEKNGTRILNANGLIESGWQKKLNRSGTSFSSSDFIDVSTIGGRSCPTYVFLNHADMRSTDRCLYYDLGSPAQKLDAAGTTGVQAVDWLQSASASDTGAGTDTSYYEGNIKICADRGMRLPTLYETNANVNFESRDQTDRLPLGDGNLFMSSGWEVSSRGVPGFTNEMAWTASAFRWASEFYWGWGGRETDSLNFQKDAERVRCVLP